MKTLLTLLLLAYLALPARSQSQPTDVQIFRDVYGNYDEGARSAKWNDKQVVPLNTIYAEHIFKAKDGLIEPSIMQRILIGSRLYVVLGAIPKQEPDESYGCFDCTIAIGAALYRHEGSDWKLEASNPFAADVGIHGVAPSDINLQQCGDEARCLVINDEICGPNEHGSECSFSMTVLAAVGTGIQSVWTAKTGGDSWDDGLSPRGILRWNYESTNLKFLSGGITTVSGDFEHGLYPLDAIRYRFSVRHGRCRPVEAQIERYVFTGQKFMRKAVKTLRTPIVGNSCLNFGR